MSIQHTFPSLQAYNTSRLSLRACETCVAIYHLAVIASSQHISSSLRTCVISTSVAIYLSGSPRSLCSLVMTGVSMCSLVMTEVEICFFVMTRVSVYFLAMTEIKTEGLMITCVRSISNAKVLNYLKV